MSSSISDAAQNKFLVAEMHHKLQDIALPLVSIMPALGVVLRYIESHPHSGQRALNQGT